MVTIAIREEEYEKAKEIGARFEDNAQIQSQMIKIAKIKFTHIRLVVYGRRYM